MKTKKSLVYFGAGGCGLAYCHHSGKMPDIFVDNDSSKWGTSINGVEIMPPAVLTSIPLHRITITSSYLKHIYPQILSLGVYQDMIHVPPKSFLGFHLFDREINRLQAAIKLHEIMATLSDRWNLVAVGGTALGFCRSNDFIHWDDDIDLFAPIKSKPAVFTLLQGLGHGPEDELGSIMKSIKSTLLLKNGVKIALSVDFFDTDSETFIDVFEDYTWEWPTRMFTQCAKIEVHGKQMNVPNPPSEYLSKVYGLSWLEPNPEFGYSNYAGKVS